MKKLLFIGILFLSILPVYGKKKETKQATPVKVEHRLSDEAMRRYQYFYLEALKQEEAGNDPEAFDLYRHCLEIDSLAAETYYALSGYESTLNNDSLVQYYLEKANSLDPENTEFAETLGQYYLAKNKIQEGAALYERISRACPDRSEYLDILTRIYQYQKDYPKVLETLNRLEIAEGQSEDLTLSKMQVYSSMGDEKGAHKELLRLVKSHPNDLNYKVMMGNWLLANGKKPEALKAYQEVLKEEPDNASAQTSLMDYYNNVGNTEEADKLLYTMLENPKTEPQTRITLMRQVVSENEHSGGDSTRVLNIFSRILSQPQKTSEMAEMEVAYMNLKKMPSDSIKSSLRRVLAISPENTQARLQLLDLMWRDSVDSKVVSECEEAIAYNPDEPALYYYLGLAKYFNKDDKGALEAFKKGINKINDNTPETISSKLYELSGDLLHSMNKPEEAYAAYDSCLAITPDEMSCLNNYAYYLSLENKDLKRAEQMSYKTIKSEPNNATYLDTYAWILYKQERYEEARIYMDQALKADSAIQSPDIYDHAGDVYIKLGLNTEACNFWQKAVDKGAENSADIKKKISNIRK